MSSEFYQYATRPARGWRFHLLADGATNSKMKKRADELGVMPFALSLARYDASGAGNVCPFASPGCSAVCLAYAGRARTFQAINQARIRKTRFWFSDRKGFLELLTRDLAKVNRLAGKKGKRAAVRLNVFSDIAWERFLDLESFPAVRFYDYSKVVKRLGRTPANYDLTFSLSETNEPEARKALDSGFNVAIPFRDRPEAYLGHPVIDGDAHDFRFLDPRPAVVGLTPKGLAKHDETGFVREQCALYGRVSTSDQSTESQLMDLRRFAADRGWQVFREYTDDGISGTKESRPALNQLMADARKRRFDLVLVWRFDRFARSTAHLINALEEFKGLGVDFVSFQESIDTSSPLGSAIFTIISAVAQLERDIIAERVKAGLRRARANGKRLGRPKGSKLDAARVMALRSEGLSVRRIARELDTSRTTVGRLLRASR